MKDCWLLFGVTVLFLARGLGPHSRQQQQQQYLCDQHRLLVYKTWT